MTNSQRTNGTYCLEVTDDGGSGWASLEIYGQNAYGTFRVIGNSIVITNEIQGGENGNTGFVFVAEVRNGELGTGEYDAVSYGESDDTGKVSFGRKGGC